MAVDHAQVRPYTIREHTDEAEIESAFAMAAAVALADDDVADSEHQVLDDLAVWFGMGPARIRVVLDQLADDAVI